MADPNPVPSVGASAPQALPAQPVYQLPQQYSNAAYAAPNQQYAAQQYQQHQVPQQAQPNAAYGEQLKAFWEGQKQEVSNVGNDLAEFKNHQLPLARIKKIMKSDEDVRMISAEAPVLFAKACEMFILELTLRSWAHAEENKRRTLQRNDIAAAITRTDIFDFLVDIVPREDIKPEPGTAAAASGGGGIAVPPEQQATRPAAVSAGGPVPAGLYPNIYQYPGASSAGLQGAAAPEQLLAPPGLPGMDPAAAVMYQQQQALMAAAASQQWAAAIAQQQQQQPPAAVAAALAAQQPAAGGVTTGTTVAGAAVKP